MSKITAEYYNMIFKFRDTPMREGDTISDHYLWVAGTDDFWWNPIADRAASYNLNAGDYLDRFTSLQAAAKALLSEPKRLDEYVLDRKDWDHILHCINVAQDVFRKDYEILMKNVKAASPEQKAGFQELADDFKRMDMACEMVANKIENR